MLLPVFLFRNAQYWLISIDNSVAAIDIWLHIRIILLIKAGGFMDTKIISGFPGVGKSECTKANSEFLDSDSSAYSWKRNAVNNEIEKGPDGKNIRHPDFPNNYIDHIKSQIGKVPIIFVSSHKDVRDGLIANGIPFTLVYPEHGLKDEYLKRYELRGSPQGFVSMLSNKWDDFLAELEAQQGCDKIVLTKGQFLADVIEQVKPISRQTDWSGKNPKRDPIQPDGTALGIK